MQNPSTAGGVILWGIVVSSALQTGFLRRLWALVLLAAFNSTWALPVLARLNSPAMSCCRNGKIHSCCKRTNHGDNTPLAVPQPECRSKCAALALSPHQPLAAGDLKTNYGGLLVARRHTPAFHAPEAIEFVVYHLRQRPPPIV
jgi:hypothetical protein